MQYGESTQVGGGKGRGWRGKEEGRRSVVWLLRVCWSGGTVHDCSYRFLQYWESTQVGGVKGKGKYEGEGKSVDGREGR